MRQDGVCKHDILTLRIFDKFLASEALARVSAILTIGALFGVLLMPLGRVHPVHHEGPQMVRIAHPTMCMRQIVGQNPLVVLT